MAIRWPWASGEEIVLLRDEVAQLRKKAEEHHKATCLLIVAVGKRVGQASEDKRVTHRPKSWSAAKSLMGEGN